MIITIRGERTRACEHLRRRCPAARHPTSGTTRETHRAWPRTPPATDPTRSGTHAACGAPRRHTMPSAQAVGKRGGGAGRTSVSQSLGLTGHFVRCTFAEGVAQVVEISEFSRKMARPAGFEPATPGLEGRKFPIWRKNTEQHGTKRNRKLGCVPCGSPATLCARPREGRERSWQAVDCPVTPRTEAETTDADAAAGHRRHPWPCAWRVGTGWRVRPRRRVRAPWAGGGPDGGRRAPRDRPHRGIIGRSWPAKSPLRGRYAAPTGRRRPPADPPIRTTRSIRPHRSSRLPVAPPHSASLSRPPERMWTDGRPPAATAKEGPIP